MTRRLSTEQRQRQIAEAALELISRGGVGGFTTAAIAEEVGLAEGTIFRHFSNKQEIALAAISLLEERLEESFPDEDLPPLERLGLFMRHRLELVIAHRGVFRAFFSDQLGMAAGPEGVARMERIKNKSLQFLRQCLSEARAEGELGSTLAPEFLLRIIQGTVQAFLFGTPTPTSEGEEPPEIARKTWSSLFDLIRK